MITVISATNRAGANTRMVAEIYCEILKRQGQVHQLIDLKDLPADFIFSAMFENEGENNAFNAIQQLVIQSDKFVFIVPEYNGSFPGILKSFIDGLKFPASFKGKVAALVGISDGTQGGALAMSHLADILNYLGMYVLPIRPRLSQIRKNLQNNTFSLPVYNQLLEQQASELSKIQFNL